MVVVQRVTLQGQALGQQLGLLKLDYVLQIIAQIVHVHHRRLPLLQRQLTIGCHHLDGLHWWLPVGLGVLIVWLVERWVGCKFLLSFV